MRRVIAISFISLLAQAEIVDRLALSVGGEIVTEKQILTSLRTAAFLNGEKAVETAAKKRETAQKLLELTMIRVEMQINLYPLPQSAQVDQALAGVKQQRFGGDETKYRAALAAAGISEANLRESLLWQLGVLSFIDFRFRPAVQIPEDEIQEYYRFEYTEEFKRLKPGQKVPLYLEARPAVVEVLTQQRIDNLLDRWLTQTESQTKVRWVESVFSEETRK